MIARNPNAYRQHWNIAFDTTEARLIYGSILSASMCCHRENPSEKSNISLTPREGLRRPCACNGAGAGGGRVCTPCTSSAPRCGPTASVDAITRSSTTETTPTRPSRPSRGAPGCRGPTSTACSSAPSRRESSDADHALVLGRGLVQEAERAARRRPRTGGGPRQRRRRRPAPAGSRLAAAGAGYESVRVGRHRWFYHFVTHFLSWRHNMDGFTGSDHTFCRLRGASST